MLKNIRSIALKFASTWSPLVFCSQFCRWRIFIRMVFTISMSTEKKGSRTKVGRAPCVVCEPSTMGSEPSRRRPSISIHWNRQMVPVDGYCCPLRRVVDNLTMNAIPLTRQTRFWSVRSRTGFMRTITTRRIRRRTAVVCKWLKTTRSVLIGWREHVHSTRPLQTCRIITVKLTILLDMFLLAICQRTPSRTAQNPPALARVLTWTLKTTVIISQRPLTRTIRTAYWSLTSRATLLP